MTGNVNFRRYGARGITVDPTWDRFEDFRDWAYANGYQAGMHMHRIDNDGRYEPDNVYFLSGSEHSKLHAERRREQR